MTTQSFIRCFKHFTTQKGVPIRIISDNGRTFKSAAKLLVKILKHPEVQGYFAGIHIQWSFHLEKVPWWGGIFERMIKSVKRCLQKTIGRGKLTMDELVTATTEVEMIVISRPLSYLSTEDIEEPLTPSHLITGRRLMSLPYNRDIDDTIEVNQNTLTKQMVYLSRVLDHSWERWKKDYLSELRNSHRHTPNKHPADPINIGNIVIVQETDQPRGFWRLAKIEDLITGSDGQVRGARILTRTVGNRLNYLQRPAQLLYPLEVHSWRDSDDHGLSDTTVPNEQGPDITVTPEQTAIIQTKENCCSECKGDY